ncbi:hypothetical protein PLEOSDRAFT_1111236 [Pleurotus ostreatus PC15]|uniref:Amine oxidase domain-containing protein n=1 Tax=Pleurotus ostreatus (strain PC15) TaxID=1137138 RepID=A0A067NTE9_PLEO1|nr:hypothetical protein PLEOSDRAFT_1111236 [Pleurotus ostreatus PC15]
MKKTVKVAVVGSGLAGLTAAYLLSHTDREENVEFEVHLFEKMNTFGMDASSISLPIPGTQDDWRVDVPMRSFLGGAYPQLIRLYKSLGASFRADDFTYSFSQLSSHSQKISATMIYNGSSGKRGLSMPSAMRRDSSLKHEPWLLRTITWIWCWGLYAAMIPPLAICYLRLLCMSMPFLRSKDIKNMTFKEWTSRSTPKGMVSKFLSLDVAWKQFVSEVMVPLFLAVCTTSEDDMMEHPIEEILDYIWFPFGTHHYVLENGVRDVVRRLSTGIKEIHLGAPISSIEPDAHDPHLIAVTCVTGGLQKTLSGFEHVVFATQANRAVPLLEAFALSLPLEESHRLAEVRQQLDCLKKFMYRTSIVINHTDDMMLPDSVVDRRDLNLVRCKSGSFVTKARPEDHQYCVSPMHAHAMTTHILRRPTGYPTPVYQTTNPIIPPRTDSILSVSKLERAVVTMDSKHALKGLYIEDDKGTGRLGRLQGIGQHNGGARIWFCGAYACKGIPLLEGCVVSARLVAEEIQRRAGVKIKDKW